jgi:hypothetical protein
VALDFVFEYFLDFSDVEVVNYGHFAGLCWELADVGVEVEGICGFEVL